MNQIGKLAKRGLVKIGNVYCPGDAGHPSFEALQCAQYACGMTDYIPADDRAGLMVVLAILGLFPRSWVGLIVRWLEAPKWLDWSVELRGLDALLAPLVRTLRLGFRGIAFGLYYSGKTAPVGVATMHENLGFKVGVQS